MESIPRLIADKLVFQSSYHVNISMSGAGIGILYSYTVFTTYWIKVFPFIESTNPGIW